MMQRQPILSGRQLLKFVTDKQPMFAGVDPSNYYIDKDSGDNVGPVIQPDHGKLSRSQQPFQEEDRILEVAATPRARISV